MWHKFMVTAGRGVVVPPSPDYMIIETHSSKRSPILSAPTVRAE